MPELESLLKGKTISLLGAGISNMPLARAAAPLAARLTVRDKKSPEALGDIYRELISLGAEVITGENYLAGIDDDIVFRSPGIRPDLPELGDAAARGALTSETEMFLESEPCRVFAVTGSDGKTTSTTITSLLLTPGEGGRTLVGGNIGEPLLYRIGSVNRNDLLAVELSSFQLMTSDSPFEAAAITNISPNHLNWHTDMDEYIAAKKRILRRAKRAVLNYDNDITREIAAGTDIPVTYFSLHPIPDGVLRSCDSAVWLDGDTVYSYYPDEGKREILSRSDIKLPGLHNTANYMTAIALTKGFTSEERILETARTFGGVEHRLEFVREKDGVTYINGSIDSSPTRTAAALSALEGRPMILIAGGSDKHISYAPLADAVFASSVRAAVLVGETAGKIMTAFEEHPDYTKKCDAGFTAVHADKFDEAVKTAAELARPGDTVILSPASASFDMFKNFEERGRYFKKLVNEL